MNLPGTRCSIFKLIIFFRSYENFCSKFLLLISNTAFASSFQKVPGTSYFLVYSFFDRYRKLYENIRRQCIISCSGIPGECKCRRRCYYGYRERAFL